MNNFKRLAKLGGHESVPDGHSWLFSKKLIAKVRKEPIGRRKLLSAAAVILARFLGKEPGPWSKVMEDSTKQYEAARSKQKKSKREEALMPRGGFAAVGKAAAKLREALPKDVSDLKGLMKLQDAWLLSFFSKHTPRLINDVSIGKGVNSITKVGKGWKITLGQHKTSKHRGASIIKLDKSLNDLTRRLVEASKKLTKHDKLLSAPRGGIMSKSQLSRRLTQITSKVLGRGFSAQILRVLKSTSMASEIKKIREHLSELGHGLEQSSKYVAK